MFINIGLEDVFQGASNVATLSVVITYSNLFAFKANLHKVTKIAGPLICVPTLVDMFLCCLCVADRQD